MSDLEKRREGADEPKGVGSRSRASAERRFGHPAASPEGRDGRLDNAGAAGVRPSLAGPLGQEAKGATASGELIARLRTEMHGVTDSEQVALELAAADCIEQQAAEITALRDEQKRLRADLDWYKSALGGWKVVHGSGVTRA